MAVSAVEQLQVMASKRQYKEAAAQLEVTYLLSKICYALCYSKPASEICCLIILYSSKAYDLALCVILLLLYFRKYVYYS